LSSACVMQCTATQRREETGRQHKVKIVDAGRKVFHPIPCLDLRVITEKVSRRLPGQSNRNGDNHCTGEHPKHKEPTIMADRPVSKPSHADSEANVPTHNTLHSLDCSVKGISNNGLDDRCCHESVTRRRFSTPIFWNKIINFNSKFYAKSIDFKSKLLKTWRTNHDPCQLSG